MTIGNAIIKFIIKHSELIAEFSQNDRLYDVRKALDKDLRRNISQDIVEQGGVFATAFVYIAHRHTVKYDAVRKVWIDFGLNGNTTFESHSAETKHL